jgi:hypothetical protein
MLLEGPGIDERLRKRLGNWHSNEFKVTREVSWIHPILAIEVPSVADCLARNGRVMLWLFSASEDGISREGDRGREPLFQLSEPSMVSRRFFFMIGIGNTLATRIA